MSMIVRRVALENVRKFRTRHEIAGLAPGLNLVVAPNETGKSTLMEAMRAALFLRHKSTAGPVRSLQPFGDDVAPEVELDFTVDGAGYALAKRFLKSARVDLSGPGGRWQGEAAEHHLQELLGFGQQSTKLNADTLGALGLLWVPQADGLAPATPGEQLRSGLGGALQEEAGALLGSAAFDRVRAQVDKDCNRWLTKTGRPTGELKQAADDLAAAETALAEAVALHGRLEGAFDELERRREELRLVQAELADPEETARRADLTTQLERARAAGQLLATADQRLARTTAEREGLQKLAERQARLVEAEQRHRADLARVQAERQGQGAILATMRDRLSTENTARAEARTARDAARQALSEGQARAAAHQRAEALRRAADRLDSLRTLEAEQATLKEHAGQAVERSVLDELAELEGAIVQAQAALDAGAARIEYEGNPPLLADGAPVPAGEWLLTREMRLDLGEGRTLWLRPPASLAGAEARLADARARHAALLAQHDAANLPALRERDRVAREAAGEVRALAAQITAETPADPLLDLAAGPKALKLLLADAAVMEPDSAPAPDVPALALALDQAEQALTRADDRAAAAQSALEEAATADGRLAVAQAKAQTELDRTSEELTAIAADCTDLPARFAAANQAEAEAVLAHAQAGRAAEGSDEGAITRQIERANRTRAAAEARRGELERVIAGLETTVTLEGEKGVGERRDIARGEMDAAKALLDRLTLEAETVRLLRDVLDSAREELSQQVIGPVAKRAARHIGRILPGCAPSFDAALNLHAIRRDGVEEGCEHLSKGTQEQLAVLSRVAFAELLGEQGQPVSLVLDDPLVWSDDLRLDAMIDLLEEVAGTMQVIVLTCRERAFRGMGGNRVQLTAV
ncbi:AAA family ATPase [Croceibacterium ferulae]|uniref:AAA family ATPase n=1 Tax=Croceibacterium ferulae TaxID=1854641 RepID=UPI000EB53D51|nr:ATP-binding protein [Croceibacterium ferulae]